ncbi:MAG: hypothetical protein ACP5SF_03230 [Thermoplasmata archaeon]
MSNIVGNMLMIIITFILTIAVLFYSLNVLDITPKINESNYLSVMLDENGSNVSIVITQGSIGTSFKIELLSNTNILILVGTINTLNNFAYVNGTFNSSEISMKILDINHDHLLNAGNEIDLKNIYANLIVNFKLVIIYQNLVVLNYVL